jgi:hypothetical protein
MASQQIDRNKLRAAIRHLGSEYVFYMLDEAIDLLPEAELLKLTKPYIDPSRLEPDGTADAGLLAAVKAFEKASLAGEYYEDFNVNSTNCTEKSTGTAAWNADCRRLLDRCVASAICLVHAPPSRSSVLPRLAFLAALGGRKTPWWHNQMKNRRGCTW